MDYAYSIDQRQRKFRIFRSTTLPTLKGTPSPLHKHEYAEVHLVERGWSRCIVEGVEYLLEPGDALLMPKGAFHRILSADSGGRHFSFQAELGSPSVVIGHFPPEFLKELFDRMKLGDNGIPTLAYICTTLAGINCYTKEDERDYKHEIGHFFDKRHHENIEVKDLANELHLSLMQTQRLVKKHTGMTFGENLRNYRMKVANYLSETTDMTWEEIAREVGYSSYSGFWKARKKEKAED